MTLPFSARRGRWAILSAVVVGVAGIVTFGWMTAADHIDSPLIAADQSADIADVYTFRSPTDSDNLILVMTISNVQAAPEIQLGRSLFDPGVLYQFEIDNDGDALEDRVIQAYVNPGNQRNQVMKVRGPLDPEVTGTQARVVDEVEPVTVRVSTGASPRVTEKDGLKVFAGVRDDPFFFDFVQFTRILAGDATSFRDPGIDTFAGLNVYAIVIEVPIERLTADASSDPGGLLVWGTTNR